MGIAGRVHNRRARRHPASRRRRDRSSLGIGLFAAVAALIGKAATAQIDPPLAAIVFVAALVASPIGAAVSVRTQPRALLVILSGIVILAAIRIAVTAVTGS